MTSSYNRSILAASSLFVLVISSYLLAKISFSASINTPYDLILMPVVISSLNITIIFAWLSLGFWGGIAASLICPAIVLWLDLRSGFFGYSVFILSFFVSAFIGAMCVKMRSKARGMYTAKLEKLEEDINILANDITLKTKGIVSLQEKLNRYSTLKAVIESLSTHLSLDEINNLIIEQTLTTLGKAGRTLLFLVSVEKQGLVLSASKGEVHVKTKTGDVFDHWVLRHRQSLIVEDIGSDFRFPADSVKEKDKIFKSLIAAPLVSESKVIGILRMDSPRESAFTQDDLRLLGIIADLGAVAAENAYLYSRTQELATKDSLTGLFVRRYFFERFRAELKRTALKQEELSILILDIDRFKNYNDKYGHAAGDIVLKYISKAIGAIVLEGDLVARYGGEEIVILLNGRSKKQAVSEAERIRKAIKDRPLTFRRHDANITVSIGVATYPDDGMVEQDLVRIADERLYKAKNRGRDRVCAA